MEHSDRFLRIVNDARSRIREVTPEETVQLLEGEAPPVLIDVREESEWEKGHIAGAIHLGKGVIERDIEKRVEETDREIILYCGGGYRSALAADNLQKMGYSNVASMSGGWREWNEREYPVQK